MSLLITVIMVAKETFYEKLYFKDITTLKSLNSILYCKDCNTLQCNIYVIMYYIILIHSKTKIKFILGQRCIFNIPYNH